MAMVPYFHTRPVPAPEILRALFRCLCNGVSPVNVQPTEKYEGLPDTKISADHFVPLSFKKSALIRVIRGQKIFVFIRVIR